MQRCFYRPGADLSGWTLIFVVQLAVCLALTAAVRAFLVARMFPAREVHVTPLNAQPHLVFACEMDTSELTSLYSDPDVTRDLRRLNAGISRSLADLSPGRAGFSSEDSMTLHWRFRRAIAN